jgi:FG-GAP-like repeat
MQLDRVDIQARGELGSDLSPGKRAPRRLRALLICLATSFAMLGAIASSASALSIGLGWMNYGPSELEIVKRSGATHYRLPIDQSAGNWEAFYDPIFKAAWEQGITISPYLVRSNAQGTRFLTSSDPGWGSWYTWTKAVVRRYGYNGSFWAGKANPRPVATWEVWNEPNLFPNNPLVGGQEQIQPQAYANFLIYTSAAVQAGSQEQSGGGTQVLFGGLYMTGTANYDWFLDEAYKVNGLYSSYNGLSIHPYAFNGKMVEFTTEIEDIRGKLNTFPWGPSRWLSITEMGWPLAGNAQIVNEVEQATLLTQSFNWVKGAAASFNIQSAFWYNIQDGGPPGNWATYCGLRDGPGNYRLSWWAFQKQTGAAPWPGPGVATGTATSSQESQITLFGDVNPGGHATSYHFDFGPTSAYGIASPSPSGSLGPEALGPTPVSTTISGVQPGTTYHYRIVATHEGGTSFGADRTFTIPGYRYVRGLSSSGGISNWAAMSSQSLPQESDTGDFDGDGKADVVNVEFEGGTSYRYRVGFSDGSVISSWKTVLGGMSLPERMAVGDVNADGKADIVSVEAEGNGKYRYMFGISNGSVISSWSMVLSGMSLPTKTAVGDVNADGKADIVSVESEGNGKYRYMFGISVGVGISSWSSVLTGMSHAEFMDVGDFSGDGKADIVSVESEGNGKYRYMRGLSTGVGISSWGQILTGMGLPTAMGTGDVNKDGKADIVSAESEGNGKYRFMFGISSGAGISSWSTALGGLSIPTSTRIADFTGDGKADVVSVESDGVGAYRYKAGVSNGTAVSSWNTIQTWISNPVRSEAADFNADGKADIVSVESEGGGKYRYRVGLSAGASGLSAWKTVLTGMGLPTAMGTGDVNKDGKADIVSAESEGNGKYRFMFGISSGAGISSWSSVLSGMSLPERMAVGDVNGDGKADIVSVESEGNGKYRYMLGVSSGAAISSWSQILSGMGLPTKMAVGDFSGDGKADIVSVESEGNGKYRYMRGLSSGAGISSWSSVLSGMSYAEFMDVGDVNADGKADIVSVEAEGNGKYRYMRGLSSGAGISSWSSVLSGMSGPYFFSLGDVDADGKADIVGLEQI